MPRKTVKPSAPPLSSAAGAILDALNSAAQPKAHGIASLPTAADLIDHVRILDPRGNDLLKMQRWPIAVWLLNEWWPKNRRTLNKKARQLGVSWSFALYALDHCARFPFRTFGSFNYNQDAAAEMLYRMRVLHSTLPPHLQPDMAPGTFELKFGNGSRALALPTTDVAGAGLTFSLACIDEAGLIKNLGDNWAAILPAIEHGQLHIFSTPRDDTGKFAQLVAAAEAGDSACQRRSESVGNQPV